MRTARRSTVSVNYVYLFIIIQGILVGSGGANSEPRGFPLEGEWCDDERLERLFQNGDLFYVPGWQRQDGVRTVYVSEKVWNSGDVVEKVRLMQALNCKAKEPPQFIPIIFRSLQTGKNLAIHRARHDYDFF